MRYLYLSVVLCVLANVNTAKASSLIVIDSNVKKSNSIIIIKEEKSISNSKKIKTDIK
ncbi:hypothetical protein lam_433 [Candidatus Liberibacter americanus str. Sao Paulo]|uniref:Uncharacterized protein n=1 Tax=Candidatus Liberibacter americanus str. Sao Paulo TaxID=1261131 RepID=U6B4H4_9HYPH|nr:hypothetical protein lam_433 [Candidatus Liberibacter americanus str. Sao Paulo]